MYVGNYVQMLLIKTRFVKAKIHLNTKKIINKIKNNPIHKEDTNEVKAKEQTSNYQILL